MDADVHFNVAGAYLYGAPASGNQLQGKLFLRPLRDAVARCRASSLVILPKKTSPAAWMKSRRRWMKKAMPT
ncbi:Uncharacterised protein [Raoultella planticola]|uniref:Bacterial Alpha-2-macroglobulin MG5 domain-containing protein n=1 Tax=Raoultella planticola TaxID=575 RepID=A0A485CAZ3_RAOPL|nr:Uncharacterised protein [Raoultella planticola]